MAIQDRDELILRASVSVIPGPNIKFEWRIENGQKKDAWAYVIQADLVTVKAWCVRNRLKKLLIAELSKQRANELSKQRANDEVKKCLQDLVNIGEKLYEAIFTGTSESSQKEADRLKEWLEAERWKENYRASSLRIELIVEKDVPPIPWGLVFSPDDSLEINSLSLEPKSYDHFWCIRFAVLTYSENQNYPSNRPIKRPITQLLAFFGERVRKNQVPVPGLMRLNWEEVTDKGYLDMCQPNYHHVFYFYGCPDEVVLHYGAGPDVITPDDLLDRGNIRKKNDKLGILFFDGCTVVTTGRKTQDWLDPIHSSWDGYISTEISLPTDCARFICDELARKMLSDEQSLGEVSDSFRRDKEMFPLNLIVGINCPPHYLFEKFDFSMVDAGH